MSSDKSDEFSLEGLDNLDVDENAESVQSDQALEEGLEFDLDADLESFELSDTGDEQISNAGEDLNEFNLDGANDIGLELSTEGESVDSIETESPDEISFSLEDITIGEDEVVTQGDEDIISDEEDLVFGEEDVNEFLLSDDEDDDLGEFHDLSDHSIAFKSEDINENQESSEISDDETNFSDREDSLNELSFSVSENETPTIEESAKSDSDDESFDLDGLDIDNEGDERLSSLMLLDEELEALNEEDSLDDLLGTSEVNEEISEEAGLDFNSLDESLDELENEIEESSLDLSSEDFTDEAKAKLEEIDAIMHEDATNAAMKIALNAEGGLDLDDNLDEFEEIMSDETSDNELEEDLLLSQIEDDEEKFVDNVESVEDYTLEDELLVEDSMPADEIHFAETDSSEDLSDDIINSSIVEESLAIDVDLDVIEAATQDEETKIIAAPTKEVLKTTKDVKAEINETKQRNLKEISVAYTGEMERTQATIMNLRADRDELLSKIEHLEEEKLLSGRTHLTLRAELDEKKIELAIIRRKLNDEINELKDKFRISDERILILEEKNKQLMAELDKAGQKNKIDIKRVMLRERELEQKLELLKADSETQIRNRDLKILELKRKIDGMEFDMESMTQQEKKTLESRFELEDKLDKAIRSLRSAITTLEEDGSRGTALDVIKKNIDM